MYPFFHFSNLNGKYFDQEYEDAETIYWGPRTSLKSAKMLIRPKAAQNKPL